MKKIIIVILPLSLFMVACGSNSNQANTQSPVTSEVETTEEKTEKTPKAVLVSPQEEIPMGEVELILEVQDSTSGKVIPVENLDVSRSPELNSGACG